MWKLALLATILWLSSTGHCQDKESFWCVQFFNKSVPHPLHMEIDETTPVGTVIRQFEVPKEDNLRVVLNEGDTYYLRYDNTRQALIVNKVLKTRLNSVLELSGVCTHNVKSYNYLFNLTVQFYVHVKEFSDPPQFINLPTVHEVPEKTKVDQEIFKIKAADLFDVNRSNITYKLLSISAKNSWANVDHMFSMDSQGKIYLKEKLDYDKGLRFFDLEIEIEDADSPPQKNTSTLTIKVTDNDDQPPRFDHSEYHITLIGEKPISTKECHTVTPVMKAEDLDPVKKSIIKYKIVSGTPSDWVDYFLLQEDNGTLCQLKTLERIQPSIFSLDPSIFPTYVLTVEAYQVDNLERKHSAQLTVNINNQNIHAPTFSQKLYRADINEYPALSRRDKVIKVTATDDDYGVNQQFRYEIIQNYKNGFSIDRTTGDISVTKPIVVDRENQDKIELKVRAVETESEEKKESDPHARVILTVKDVNDNSPKFKKSFYSFEIKDSLGFHELVHPKDDNLKANDPDFAENGTVVYTITRVSRQGGRASFNDISRFKMDEQGNLRVGQSLRDLRRKGTFPEYRVTVKAEDQAEDSSLRRSSTARVDIKVLEANDYPPIFQSKRLSVSVSEATAIGSRVTKLEATDEDGDEDLYLTYKISGGNSDKPFSISKSGYLTTAKVLDREAKAKYELTVEVSDGVHEAEATVEVNVKDVNDHAPEFTKSTFEFTLMENSTEGEIFGTVTAVDEDTGINGQITYTLVGKGAEYFGIKPNGDIFVRRISKLIDKEQNDNIILQVKAVDAGEPPSQDVAGISIEIVDVNDNAPLFSQSTYQGYIEEGQSIFSRKTLVQMEHKIEANDADKTAENRNIRYRLSGSGSEKFSLHPVSGVIRVKNPASIDCEIKCEYRLKIIARDQKGQGLEGGADLVITVKDINDNAPTFEEDYVINIEPWTTVGTKIKTIKATDNDKTDQNNKIMYLLRSGGVGKFQLDFDTGDLVVVDKLTRAPELEEYILDIKAVDSGKPRLSANGKVTIRTTVNQQPVMQNKHYFEIPESLPVDSVIGKINATNPDDAKGLVQKLKYVISSEYDVPFRVDADSGVLETKSMLDAETLNKYIFPVIVTDNGYPPGTVSTMVTINVTDVNDEPPRFTYDTYFGSVVEDDHRPIKKQRVKLEKTFSHIDKDETPAFQTVTFSLSGKESNLFTIDALTSEISVTKPGSIDCEKRCRFQMMVHISNDADPHLIDSAVLIINVTDTNDNAPVMNELSVIQIPRNTPLHTNIAQLLATDNDSSIENNQITYFLMRGGFDKFALDMNTGSIKVIDDLSREPQHEEYRLHVMAEDSGVPKQTAETLVRIQIPVNNPPTLPDNILFDVREDVTLNTSIGHVVATDPDVLENGDHLEYSLDSKAGPFVIDKLSGEVFVSRLIDAEIISHYEFTISAKDHGIPQNTATSTVTVRVTDVNDNPPIFEQPFGYKTSIPEGFGGYLPITPAIKTKDADISLENQEVKFSLKGHGSKFFTIDPYTAEIAVKRGHHLDCESEDFYSLQIVAKNKKLATKTSLDIYIEDLNDHTPEFLEEYSFLLDPDTKIGTTIGQMQAKDEDRTTKNNRFTFFLKSGSFEKFAVNAKTGELTLISNLLDDPQREKYDLDIIVSDSGHPQLSTNSRVIITVPLNKPPLLSNHSQFYVNENASEGYIVGQVECEDPDFLTTQENRMRFYLQSKTDLFAIDQLSGHISLSTLLDAETTPVHHFGVTVVDSGSPPFTVSTTVTVHVLDNNDNPPILTSETGYLASITEGTDINPILVTPPVMVIDSDVLEENRKVVYSLRGQGADIFDFEPTTGVLQMRDYRLIDCEEICEYNLTIVASDPEDISLYSNRRLTIEIKDANDNSPVFHKTDYQFLIPPYQILGSIIASIKATDADFQKENNRIMYSLVRGGLDRFSLDSRSGGGPPQRQMTNIYKKFNTTHAPWTPASDCSQAMHRVQFRSSELKLIGNLTSVPLQEEYTILIKAVDSGVPQLSAEATVNIHVPLNKPPKLPENVQFSVYENTSVGDVVGRITATDPDNLTNSKSLLEYSMKNEDILKIDKITGQVRLSSQLDAETDLVHHSVVMVTDAGLPSFTISTTLTIQVVDVNDNSPNLIVEQDYHARVSEAVQDKPIPVIPPISVNDADVFPQNKMVRYVLLGAGSHKFKIDKYGILRVRPKAILDCERKCKYYLKVKATDPDIDTLSSVANLKISIDDVNDNAPIFTNTDYQFTVDPFSPFGEFIGTIRATDKDFTFANNQVNYDLLCEHCRFTIDSGSGRLTLASNLSDSPFREEYKFMVIAEDSGTPSLFTSANVTVRVPLNHPPEVPKSFLFNITENVRIGYIMGQVSAFDPDISEDRNQEIFFQLQDTSGLFKINKTTGELSVNGPLDAETTSIYHIIVLVVNPGIPVFNVTTTVTIRVIDVNDYPPVLTAKSYFATITEETASSDIPLNAFAVDFTHARVTRADQTGLFNFPIINTVSFGHNSIRFNALNSWNTVQSVLFDEEKGEKVPMLKTVDLDVRKEHQQFEYRLSGENHEKFQLDPFSGLLKVKENEIIDCEEICAFHLKVMAVDPNHEDLFSEAPLTISVTDINDNKPVFSQNNYQYTLRPEVSLGFHLGDVMASDADATEVNNQIRYYIAYGGYDKFSIDNQTGELTVRSSLVSLPYFEEYHLDILAVDSGHPQLLARSFVNIHVQLNKPPVFSKTFHFDVSENASIDQTIGCIESKTHDGSTFAFSLKAETDIFKIHRKSGELKLKNVVDAERSQDYHFDVVISKNGIPSHTVTTSVTVNILDINDNPPLFATPTGYIATVKEGTIGQVINTIPSLSVTDADILVSNRNVVYFLQGEGSEKFNLDEFNCTLSLNKDISFNCEEKCEYYLTIIARDPVIEGLWSQAPLRVTVEDINDNAPEFKEHKKKYVLNPNSPTGTRFGIVEAFDNDATENNNQIIYSLLGGNSDMFSINSQTGELILVNSLIREPMQYEYTLAIAVFDNGFPRLSSETTVKIIVPENHSPIIPAFLSFEVFENKMRGTIVGKMEAKDEDITSENSTQQLTYKIIEEVPFTIVPDKGIIHTTSNLDAEEHQKYTFTISVSDNGIPVRNTSSLVTVHIKDKNDHAPIFSCGETYNATITEEEFDTSINVFPPISAKDHDISPANQNITYQLLGEGSDKFILDPLTATIELRRPWSIDCEKQCEYLLKVAAIDQGGRGKQTEANLYIHVIDINDNIPEFKDSYSFSVSPSSPIGNTIGQIEAFDQDSHKPNNIFTYILTDGAKGKFKLDAENGVLTVAENLFNEPLQEIYKLTVEVRDFGIPQHSTKTTIEIYVPLNKPANLPQSVIFYFQENELPGTVVGRINVTNPEEDISSGKSAVTFRTLENDFFDIDPTSGEIKSVIMLDAETQEIYKFSSIVLDEGFPSFTTTVSVTVFIQDINDHPPVLSSTNYFAEINEGYYPDYFDIQLTPPLSMTDKDETEKNRITQFSIVGYGEKYFVMNSTTGHLQIKELTFIDCERKCKFDLKIKARNYEKPGLRAVANILIKVKDINDHRPLIDKMPPIHISPITEQGTVIAKLTASDLDKDPQNNKFMFILQGDTSFKFNVHPLTGDITVVDKLSREPQKEQYNLQVLAMDFGYPSLSSNTTVKIIVPVNKPVTVAPTNSFHVSEGVSIGTEVGTVNASDPDMTQENDHSLIYILTNPSVPFKIGNKTGIIETAGELDAELASTYQFGVQILDSDLPPTTATTIVTIVVEDINDNSPELSSKVYRTTVSEGQLNARPLVLNLNPPLSAEDKDKNLINRHIRYYLKGKNSDLFRLSPRSGILKIKDASTLDSENQQKYRLSIVAFDGTFQSQANLIIEVEDINDNIPIFSGPYFYQVNPRATIGTKFGQVVAKDKDASSRNNRILYVLAQGSGGKFGVDFISGDLYVASNLTDSPQEEEYNLVVQGFDTGEPSLASNTTVRVRVALNKAPVVDPNFVFQIPENMTTGSTVGMIPVFDPDMDHNPLESIKFSISDPTNNFAISEKDGRINTKTVLDRETQEQFIFTVYCENDGAPSHTVSTTVTVILEDLNDNAPIFKSATGYHGTYREGDPRGTITLNQELIATDADVTVENQNIVYQLVGKDSDLFQLNTVTGSIKVRSPSRVHCDYKDNYNLKIIAIDQGGKGHTSLSTINIEVQDINDNAPRFTEKYDFRVPITAKEGSVIGSVNAIDNDCTQQNNRITYLLKDGGFGKFKIDPDKGEIIIADSLFREPMRNEYNIVVKAVDNGAPGLSNSTNVTILVPVNHPPSVKNSFHFHTMEANKIGQYVGKLIAEDKDLGIVKGEKLTFTLVDKTVPFAIHPRRGDIRTNDIIDREKMELYDFKVMVNDNGVPAFTATTNVMVIIKDYNDNAPEFIHGLEYRGTVVEDDRYPIAKQRVELSKNLTVIDHDATISNRKIKFSLKGPHSKLFRINSHTGDIYVDRPGKIDRELNRELKLKIVATDQNGKGLSTEADLTVEVKDVNDHDPRFVQALYEFVLPSIVEAGYEVGRLIAIDRDDTSPNNKLLYIFESDSLGKFKIDVGTGVLTLLEGFFSKPRKTTYTFTVAAMDMGFPSRKTKAQVIVNAPHMVYNDHAPKFEGRNVFILKEELPIGSLVGTLEVTDEDRKKNNSVNLIIDPADERYVPFAIKNDGSIITTKRIDRDAGYEYFRFTVHATDSGAPPHNTSQEVGIIVDDINDNPPHFTMDTYQHMIASNFPASTIIATPFAFDDVDKTDSVYQYSLLGGTPGYFYIDQQTGVIRTTDLARSLKPGKMEFKVVAQDLYNKTLTAEAKLNIQIIQTKQGRKSTCCRVPC